MEIRSDSPSLFNIFLIFYFLNLCLDLNILKAKDYDALWNRNLFLEFLSEISCFTFRYQYPTSTLRSSSALGNPYTRPPRSTNSPMSNDQCITMRSLSPICKYALIDGTGQHIPVCTNVVTFANSSGDFQLAEANGTATLCFPSDYQPIPISYVNVSPMTDQMSGSSPERLCTVTAAGLPPDSDIIVNTQVTHV